MMKTIWKYPIETTEVQQIGMPQGAEILCVQMQASTPCLWALCEHAAPRQPRTIRIFGTGNPITEEPGRYIGTYQLSGGALVFHVFEE